MLPDQSAVAEAQAGRFDFGEAGQRHLCRNATIGSTCVAQRAGMKQANNATAQSRSVTVENVSASVLVTPKSKLFRKRVKT